MKTVRHESRAVFVDCREGRISTAENGHAGQKTPATEQTKRFACLIRQWFLPTRAKNINFLLHGRK